jgi:hypothetical protein
MSKVYPLHGQIPILIHKRLVSDREKRDLPGSDLWRSRVYREELDIQRVQFICMDRQRSGLPQSREEGSVPIGIMHSQ